MRADVCCTRDLLWKDERAAPRVRDLPAHSALFPRARDAVGGQEKRRLFVEAVPEERGIWGASSA